MSTSVISSERLREITARAQPEFVAKYTRQAVPDKGEARRKELHEKSLKETSQWPGTVLGERQRRLEAKAKRKEARERELEQIDLEEARYQAKVREEQLNRAKELIMQQKDEIRGVRSAEFLTEVLRERAAQSDSSVERQRAMDAYYAEFERAKRAEDEAAIEAEAEKQRRMRLAELDTAQSQLEQAAARRAARLAQRQAELAEQRVREADAADYRTEQERKDQAAKEAQVAFREEMDRMSAAKAARRAQEAELARMELTRDAEYEKQKELMYAERSSRAVNARKQVIAQRDALVTQLYTVQISNDSAEDARIAKAIEEQTRKRDEEEAAKQRAREEAQVSILSHMNETVERKAAARKSERDAAVAEQARILREAEEYYKAENAKMAKRRSTERGIQSEWNAQIAAHKRAVAEAHDRLVELRLDNEKKTEQERLELMEYAERRLQAARERGCDNVYPMTKSLEKLKPWEPKPAPNLPSVMTRRRGNPYPGNSKARMGFTM